ncbi:uncharacterized protein LOC108665504 [Hyalella azteca]|uniref:Uncharacterized protein LOC108665504 n=1 Tax=Hyalella azteca TaxID=294128 RepID=A0A8B7N3D8_HYAAZ|nr:uncharacterized protein LOC108665504 [Hyalella azteca]
MNITMSEKEDCSDVNHKLPDDAVKRGLWSGLSLMQIPSGACKVESDEASSSSQLPEMMAGYLKKEPVDEAEDITVKDEPIDIDENQLDCSLKPSSNGCVDQQAPPPPSGVLCKTEAQIEARAHQPASLISTVPRIVHLSSSSNEGTPSPGATPSHIPKETQGLNSCHCNQCREENWTVIEQDLKTLKAAVSILTKQNEKVLEQSTLKAAVSTLTNQNENITKEIRLLRNLICNNNTEHLHMDDSKLPKLPLKSIDDINALEETLSSAEERSRLIHHLSLVGGSKFTSVIHNAMKALLSKNLAMEFSLEGKKKRAFKALKAHKCIVEAVMKSPHCQAATVYDINKVISLNLTGARDRDEGRKRRYFSQAPNSSADQSQEHKKIKLLENTKSPSISKTQKVQTSQEHKKFKHLKNARSS